MKFTQAERKTDWATSFETLRIFYVSTIQSLRAGETEKNWPVLNSLAMSCPHFLLDWSGEYTETRIAEKLSVHLMHALCSPAEKASLQATSPPMFTIENGDELMVRAALNWSPRQRFRLDEIEEKNTEWGLIELVRSSARKDHIVFDALGMALDFVAQHTSHLELPASILLSDFLKQELLRPKRSKDKRPAAKTVHRRLATRLFLHEMNELGFEIGSNRGKRTGDKACDAAHAALRRYGHTPPSVGTLLEDWNEWNFKGT